MTVGKYLMHKLMCLATIYYKNIIKQKPVKKILFDFINNVSWRRYSRLMVSNRRNENVLINQSTFSKCNVTLATKQHNK